MKEGSKLLHHTLDYEHTMFHLSKDIFRDIKYRKTKDGMHLDPRRT